MQIEENKTVGSALNFTSGTEEYVNKEISQLIIKLDVQ